MMMPPPRSLLCLASALALGLPACVGPSPYDPAPTIALAPSSLDVARDVNQKIEDALSFDGDFHPNDLIRISFPYFPLLTSDQRVQMSGMISPPMLAPLQTKGLSAAAVQARLAQMYQSKLEHPTVAISVLEYNRPPPPPEVFVLGEVTRPGNFPYRDGTSIFEGLARAGGPNRDADLSRVVLLAPVGGRVEARLVDLRAVLEGQTRASQYLSPFSILIVPATGVARDADRSRQIRAIIGYNGINLGSNLAILNP